MNAVATVGPMAISAAAEPWQSYESGVFKGTSADVDHAIQLVGYGTVRSLQVARARRLHIFLTPPPSPPLCLCVYRTPPRATTG